VFDVPVASRSRACLRARLQARRSEIEQAILARVYAISDPIEVVNPEYAPGLRVAVTEAIDYGTAAIEERGEKGSPPIPAALLGQARLAARSGIGIDTVVRRYFAGYAQFGDFLVDEVERSGSDGPLLKSVLRDQAVSFDRLLGAVGAEYVDEVESKPQSAEQRRAEHVKRLLAGELLDISEIAYEFDGYHLGFVATGADITGGLKALARSLDCRLLYVQAEERTWWVWLGGRRPPDPVKVQSLISSSRPSSAAIALGEPGEGLAGWRLSHRQAHAALPIALRFPERLVRYSEVALLASVLRDDLLATSLHHLYIEPLRGERDGGRMARETLRAYYAADRNVSSAAAALGVNRHTVAGRLRAIEERLGFSPYSCAADIETALQLDQMGYPARSGPALPRR
jgi:hypothetical protein